MERKKETTLLFLLLLALPHVCTSSDEACPEAPDKDLPCYTDYNRIITCMWNSTNVPEHADTVCTIHGNGPYTLKSSCTLKPVNVSRSSLMKCSMVYEEYSFISFSKVSIDLSCNPGKQRLKISFWPACHIKLDPPPKPEINFTIVSWFPQVEKHRRIYLYRSQLQWRQEDQSWSDEQTKETHCKYLSCKAELDRDLMMQYEKYEARIRVQAVNFGSTWSDWGPTASWVSPIGKPKPTPPPPSELTVSVLGTTGCVAAFALLLILIKMDKTTWVYIVKRIRGPPLPNPKDSFLHDANFQNWLSPHFASDSFHSFLKREEIVAVEVTSVVDAVAPHRPPEAALQEKMRIESSKESTSSSFSNPSYSQVSPPPPPPPVSSLTAGNLPACDTDAPYGPVCSQHVGVNVEQHTDEVRGKEVGILQLTSVGSNNSEPMLMISDYEKVEKPQLERNRLQSLDSGVCSGEEVSQESLEADSISDGHDEGQEGKEEREEENAKEVDFQKLFRGSGGIFIKGSIQVCSGYEQVQKMQADGPELASLDSGVSSGGEEQLSQEDSLEDVEKATECMSLLFPPPPALACFLPSFTPSPLNFSGAGLSPALRPPPSHILERTALMSCSRSVEPSGDGYMPVRQEQC